MEVLFGGENPYVAAMKSNMAHLIRVLKADDWNLLRRSPPFFVGDSEAVQNVDQMVRSQLAEIPLRHADLPGYISA
jgi:hypothetical protein